MMTNLIEKKMYVMDELDNTMDHQDMLLIDYHKMMMINHDVISNEMIVENIMLKIPMKIFDF